MTSQNMACPSCSDTRSAVLASVITAIATALLAIVVFVLVQIAVCKCRPKSTTGAPAGGEGQVYEQVDGGEGGVALSDPTYMEVAARRGGMGAFQFEENEAYGKGSAFQLEENEAYAVPKSH